MYFFKYYFWFNIFAFATFSIIVESSNETASTDPMNDLTEGFSKFANDFYWVTYDEMQKKMLEKKN